MSVLIKICQRLEIGHGRGAEVNSLAVFMNEPQTEAL